MTSFVDSASVNALATPSSYGAVPTLTVADAMHWGVVSCPSGASLETVAMLMSDRRVHCIVVIDDPTDDRSLWGVVSDLDLVAASTVRGLRDQKAGGTAMTPAVTIAPAESLERAAQLMTKHAVTHLVVIDSYERRPVGVLSTLDLAAALAPA